MRLLITLCLIGFTFFISCTATRTNTATFDRQSWFDDSLKQIITDHLLDSSFDVGEDGLEQVSFAVISLDGQKPLLGGVNMENFIYPASVYKMYIAMEVLRQINEGRYSLYTPYVVKSPNVVDRSSAITWDSRPLLRENDTVTVDYLLDLMISKSDNTASNCLIDLAGRPNINRTMHHYGWHGSEVTRKFLSRAFEDPGYDTIAGTETNALHAAEFMYRIYDKSLVNTWVSNRLKSYLSRQLDTTKIAAGLPRNTMFYNKSGWWRYYTNDVGIVESEDLRFIIALFTPVPEERARERIHAVTRRVYQLLLRNKTH